jgi:hypothetical protein
MVFLFCSVAERDHRWMMRSSIDDAAAVGVPKYSSSLFSHYRFSGPPSEERAVVPFRHLAF